MNIDDIIQKVAAHGSPIICCSPDAVATLIPTNNVKDEEWHLTRYKDTPVVVLPRKADNPALIYVLPTNNEKPLKPLKVFFED